MNRFLEYDGYRGSVEYSKEDALFYGMLQGVEDCVVLYEGKNMELLLDDFVAAVEDYKVLKRIEAIKRKKYGI